MEVRNFKVAQASLEQIHTEAYLRANWRTANELQMNYKGTIKKLLGIQTDERELGESLGKCI